MKVIKISAIWCGSCLITNKAWNRLTNGFSFYHQELDIDMDEELVSNYKVGDKLPVFIIMDDNKEIDRFSGEYSYHELKDKLKEAGVINEK